MRFYDPEEIRRSEKFMINELGASESLLMENAGGAAAQYILQSFPKCSLAVVLVGPGNNGGDGCVVARHLLTAGWNVTILSVLAEENFKGINDENKRRTSLCGASFLFSANLDDETILSVLEKTHVVIDGLLGTGSQGTPRGEVARLIRLSSVASRVVALDLPSGVDPKSGKIGSDAVSAVMTLTMIAPKTGLAFAPGRNCSGNIIVVNIGFPPPADMIPCVESLTEGDASALLPELHPNIHKGERGGILVVGGCEEYRGAPILALRGALRSGGGLAVLFSDEIVCTACSSLLPEAIVLSGLFSLPDAHIEEILEQWEDRIDCLVLGPGLGRAESAGQIVVRVFTRWRKKIIVDGDGLFWLGHFGPDILSGKNVLLTPHEGEASRLLCVSPEAVRQERLSSARALAKRWGTVLLKGQDTIVDDGTRSCVVSEGNRTLAIPGSGDVLSGIVGALAAAGMTLFESAVLGAMIHGKSGRLLSEKQGCDGVLASELADEIPQILGKMRTNAT